jgi:hypothetical protein
MLSRNDLRIGGGGVAGALVSRCARNGGRPDVRGGAAVAGVLVARKGGRAEDAPAAGGIGVM